MAPYPAERSVWSSPGRRVGTIAKHDPAELQTTSVAEASVDFGVFVARGTTFGLVKPSATDTGVYEGVSLESAHAGNYDASAFIAKDVVPVLRRGFASVKIDTDNKPSAGGTVYVYSDSGKEGYLKSTDDGTTKYLVGGVRIEYVGDNYAVVYLDGSAILNAIVAAPDTTAPTVSDGTITFTSVTSNEVELYWEKATDDVTSSGKLVYAVYRSTSDNISTVSDAETNGTKVTEDKNINTAADSGLTTATTYYYNVVVADEAGNKTAYTANSVTTT